MAGIWKIFERWLDTQRDREFVEQMNSLAESDIGMTRDELQSFISDRPETREQLVAMAKRFGLSEKQIDEKRWRALELTKSCGHCSKVSVCRRFLSGDEEAGDPDTFCPNAQTFRQMSEGRQ